MKLLIRTFLFLSFWLLPFSSAFAVIVVDAVVSTEDANKPSSLIASHPVSGVDRFMLVGISIQNEKDEYVTSVSYGGSPLTKIGSQKIEKHSRVEIWSMVAPPVGTANVVVTFNTQIEKKAGMGVTTFTGVDQTTPAGTFVSNTGQSSNANLTISSASDELAYAVVASIEQNISASSGSGVTELWNYRYGNFIGAGGTKAGAASVDMSWSLPKSKDWAIAGVSIKPSAVVISASIVANYAFDEQGWDGTSGEVTDSTGGTDGTAAGGADTFEPGRLCQAGSFDGSNDYVQVPNLSSLLNGTASLAFWIKTTQPGNDTNWQAPGIIGYEQFGGVDDIFWGWLDASGHIGISKGDDNNAKSNTVINDGIWHHVALTRDASSGAYTIYIDGTLDQSGATNTGTVGNSYSSIGRIEDSGGTPIYFDGDLDEVIVFDGIVTATDVLTGYNNQVAGNNWDGTTRTCVSSCVTTNFRDDFSTSAFSNQDGSENWSGDWTEYDFSSTGVSGGHVSISGGDLLLTNVPESQNYPGVVREADLSSFDTATLSFSFSTQGNVDAQDSLLIKVSPNGGVTWTTLEDITGIGDLSNQQRSYDITSYMSTDTQISLRFSNEADSGSTVCCYGGTGEEILFDYVDIEVEDCTPSALDHLRIEHSGVGLTCQRSDVIIRACEDASCTTEYTDPVTVTLSPATANPPVWIGGDTQTFSGGSGTYQLRQTTPATVTLGISSPSPAPANSPACYSGGSPGSCDIEFFETGFIFDVPDQTSCQTSSTVSIQAVRADATAQTCVADAGFAGASKTVNFWSSYTNPISGTEQVSLSGTNVTTSSPGTGIPLTFDGTATSSFTAHYPDAGQLQLDARYDGVGAEETGLVMLGSDSFTVRPVGLCVYSDDANADCAAGNGSCSEFRKVDENFNLKVKAVCWESSVDTDFCGGNPITQNFALNTIPITHTLLAPTTLGSNSGSIAVASIDLVEADNGEHIIGNQSVSEVGVFTFTASPPDYFGVALPVATSTNIGRFTPDHFVTAVTANGALENACTGFTYTGQNFSYEPFDRPIMTTTATDSSGNTTVNYRDDFVKLTDPATQISMPAVTADASNMGTTTPLALTWTPVASSLVANDDGTLTFTFGGDQFSYTREPNALVAPFTSDIRLIVSSIADSDGIAASDLPRSFIPTGIEIRYGQLELQNSYGPETLPLTLNLSAEYFNGSSFVTNNLDSCTPYDSLDLRFSNYQGNLTSGETTPAGNGTLAVGMGTNMSLSAPGAGNDGSVDLSLDLSQATGANLEWLQPGGVNPTGKATFGIFKGNQRLIYMRESVQ